MPQKSIVVIGAGVSGLSAGCYGQMNGYRVQIFEQDVRPGGLCTSWERKGYTINGGLAFLGGSGPGTNFYRIWEELGVVPKVKMIDYEYFEIVEGKEGKTFFMHTDLDRLEEHMKDLAPEDKKIIEDFIRGIRIFTKYQLPIEKAQELFTPLDKVRLMLTHLPLIRAMRKWKKVSIKEFAGYFQNPFLREAIFQAKALFSDDFPVVAFQLFLAWSYLKSAGYPQGGALELAKAMEERFLGLGGRVEYRTRVSKILVENNRAVGIRLEDGSEHHSDYVISAADFRTTVFDMLDGKFIDDEVRSYFDKLPVGPSVVAVALGISRQFEDFPHCGIGLIYPLQAPVIIAGQEVKSLRPMVYNFDPTLAPEGKTLVRIVLPSDYDYWKSLREEADRYQEEKEKVARIVIDQLEHRFKGISSQVEMYDVATPLTFEGYTGNWKGSIIGWDATTETFFKPMRKTLPGLAHFWMAGQWLEPGGGMPMVALSGRNVIQLIAKNDRKPFIAETP